LREFCGVWEDKKCGGGVDLMVLTRIDERQCLND
jgi:hypothetical protein